MISDAVINTLKKSRRIVVFCGAGLSTNGSVPTLKDEESGLWRQYQASQLATPEAFAADPELVWGWHEWRRTCVLQVEPTEAHVALAQWHEHYPFTIVTENTDDLHERAGSYNVIHIHGSLFAPRCTKCGEAYHFERTSVSKQVTGQRLELPLCYVCQQKIRPGITWFGEAMHEPDLRAAIYAAENCDVLLAVGTTGSAQPAALMPVWAKQKGATVIQINPNGTPLDKISDYNVRAHPRQILPKIVRQLGFG